MRLASNAPVPGRRLLHSILAFIIGIAWVLTNCTPTLASTSATTAPSWIAQTEPPPGQQPAEPDSGFSGELFPDPNEGPSSPDSAAVLPDSAAAAAPDSGAAAAPDSAAAQPDSAAAGATFKPKSSALPDTLEFLPAPGSQAGGAAKPDSAAPVAPKQRTGILGIHPIAILFGIAALHYFIIKVVAD